MRSPIRDRFGLVRLTGWIDASLEKHFWRWASSFTLVFLACSIVRDLRTTFWFDELFTLYIAKLASPREIVDLGDASPPLYPIIAHWLLPIVQNDALAVRLPATLGYCAMILFLMAFCRRRLPAAFAFAAALLAFEPTLYYATEGRAYGLVLGCAAGSLLFWQMAAEGRGRRSAIALLALCLALMVALHYYAIFFLVPLVLAEAVRWRTSGRVDVAVAAALLPALLVLGLHYSLLVAGQTYDTNFWAHASLEQIAPFYERFLLPVLVFCGLASIAALVPRSSARPRESMPRTTFPLHEWTAIAALVLMPPVVIVVSMVTTHAFIERYVLWTAIGFALLGAACLSAAVRGRAAVGVALIGIAIAAIVRLEIGPLTETPVLRTAEVARQELDRMARDGSEPIVLANAHMFMELSYYLSPPLRDRLVFPLSRELDLRYRGFDTDVLTLGPLGRRGRISVKAYDDVLRDHKRFLLAAGKNDYLPQHLAAAGYRVTPLREATMLYQVQAPGE